MEIWAFDCSSDLKLGLGNLTKHLKEKENWQNIVKVKTGQACNQTNNQEESEEEERGGAHLHWDG